MPDRLAAEQCSLCGGPNDCALANAARSDGERCWCVERRFPPALLERARARDGGAACVCRRCLDAAERASLARGREVGR